MSILSGELMGALTVVAGILFAMWKSWKSGEKSALIIGELKEKEINQDLLASEVAKVVVENEKIKKGIAIKKHIDGADVNVLHSGLLSISTKSSSGDKKT